MEKEVIILIGLLVAVGIIDLLLDYKRTPRVFRAERVVGKWNKSLQNFSGQNIFEDLPAVPQEFSKENLDKLFKISREIKLIGCIWAGMIFLIFVLAVIVAIDESSFYNWAFATIWGFLLIGTIISCKEKNKVKADTEIIDEKMKSFLSLADKRNKEFFSRSADLGRFLALVEKKR